MDKEPREMCLYCGKWFNKSEMVTMFEKGKLYGHYCESCYPDVKYNISSLPYRDTFTFYRHKL